VPYFREVGRRTSAFAGPDTLTLDSDVEHHRDGDDVVAELFLDAGEHAEFRLTWSTLAGPATRARRRLLDLRGCRERSQGFVRAWSGQAPADRSSSQKEVAMAEVRYEQGRTGLVVIDTVNDFLSEGGKAYPLVKDELDRIGVIENLKRLLSGARERGLPIIFAPMSYTEEDFTTWKHLSGIHKEMYDNRMFEAGSWGADFHPQLSPQTGEIIVAPHKNIDVYATTDLDTQLRQHNVEYVAFAGMSGTLCVESSARTAMERGYHVSLIKDATAAVGGMEAYEAMIGVYHLITHAVLTVDEYLQAYDRSAAAMARP
jgi:nicotinamidase-related amidase